jgi:hypothetical protein
MPFWKMIKEGYDHFEVTRQEPKVDFCEKKYVFDAVKPPDAKRDPVFEASAKCPAYVIPDEVAEAVREKQDADHVETAKLIERGTPVARINTGIDGGMHRVFAAKLPGGNTGLSEGGTGLALLTLDKAPGTIPPGVNPPRGPVTSPEDPFVASLAPAGPPASGPRVASAAPTTQNTQSQNTQSQNTQSEGFFSSLARKVGLGGTADTTATTAPPPAPAKPKVADAKPPRPEASIPKGAAPKADTKPATTRPPLKPTVTDTASAPSAPAAPSVVAGAQPVLSANSFESRFSAAK